MMFKSNQRLSGRPVPPTSEQRDDDIQLAEKSDVVFTLGQKYLNDYYKDLSPTTNSNDSGVNSSLNTSSGSTESEVSQDKVNESYGDVLTLLSLYSSLKDVPMELEEKYSRLKNNTSELTESIAQLRELSVNFESSCSEVVKSKSEVTGKSNKNLSGSTKMVKAKSRKKN